MYMCFICVKAKQKEFDNCSHLVFRFVNFNVWSWRFKRSERRSKVTTTKLISTAPAFFLVDCRIASCKGSTVLITVPWSTLNELLDVTIVVWTKEILSKDLTHGSVLLKLIYTNCACTCRMFLENLQTFFSNCEISCGNITGSEHVTGLTIGQKT